MAQATYKDLCIDATDAMLLGRFWADALGLDLEPSANGAVLNGPKDEARIWVNQVPEPKTVKHRIHLDLNVGSVDEIDRLGAEVIDDENFRWTVMTDPEGGELCVFVRDGEIKEPLYEVVVDTDADPRSIAAWWADLLGARLGDSGEDFSYVEKIPNAPFEFLVFGTVPEPKTVKNRIHLDVTTDDLDALVAAGAKLLRPQDDEISWNVMADPDGNEFCAFVK
jgi:hypothetical protein